MEFRLQSVEQLFADRTLLLEQSTFHWTRRNIAELLDDIQRSDRYRTPHFLGLLGLVPTTTAGHFKVVYGKQRLMTLTLLLRQVIGLVSVKNIRNELSALYLGSESAPRLRLPPEDDAYFRRLFCDQTVAPESESQAAMAKAYRQIQKRTKEESSTYWSRWATRMQVLICIAPDEAHARWIEHLHFARGTPRRLRERDPECPTMQGHLDILPFFPSRRPADDGA